MDYRQYLKNISKVFGKFFEAVVSVFRQEGTDPENLLKVRDWKKEKDGIPTDFLPLVAWENGCLYDYLFFGNLTQENIRDLRKFRAKEGTEEGLEDAVNLVPIVNSCSFEKTAPCQGNLHIEIETFSGESFWEFFKKDWAYLFYLICDYKRASLWLTLLLERILETDLYAGAGIINSANVTMPVQPLITGGEPLYAGCGIIECRETVFPVQVIN